MLQLRLTRPPIGSDRGANGMRRGGAPAAAAAGELGHGAAGDLGICAPPRAPAATRWWWWGALRRLRSRHRGIATPLPLLTAAAFVPRLALTLPLYYSFLIFIFRFLKLILAGAVSECFPGRRDGHVLRDCGNEAFRQCHLGPTIYWSTYR
jgi:hypothetical protein